MYCSISFGIFCKTTINSDYFDNYQKFDKFASFTIKKSDLDFEITLFALSKADSNHHKQNQNLLCYHYTIGQACGKRVQN